MGYVMVGTNTISLFWIVGAYIPEKTNGRGTFGWLKVVHISKIYFFLSLSLLVDWKLRPSSAVEYTTSTQRV